MNYKKIDQYDIDFLTKIVGEDFILIDNQIEKDYAKDELGTITHYPEVLLFVENKYQISKIMKYANDNHIPVTVRGSGTGLVGACVPVCGGILLETLKMNKVIELDAVNNTLRVEPGVLLMDVYEAVDKEGFFYAPDPGEKSATIAGNIATNAGGMRAVKYGVTRDWIRGLEIVLPDGEIITLGGKVVKDSSGYSLKDLIIGSEGTLGIIVEATLKLIPAPKEQVSLLIPFKNRKDAIHSVSTIINTHALPTAVEFLEKESLLYSEEFLGKKIPHADHEAYLLITYDGNNKEEVNTHVDVISDLCVNQLGAIDAYLVDTEERRQMVWSARGAFLEAIKASTTQIDECDVVLPRKHIADYLDFTNKLSQELGIRIPYFGHVGDGNLHIYFCKDDLSDEVWEKKKSVGFNKMYQEAFKYDGLVSGEHGIGYAKKEYLKQQVGATQLRIMREIKQVFDPNLILNPNKIVF